MEIILNNVQSESFKNLNMCIFDNQITSIVGNNGSGKSILAEIISTFRHADGQMIIDKNGLKLNQGNINYNQLRFDIGIVMQNVNKQILQETVYEQISLQLNAYKYKNTKKRIIDSLKMVGLSKDYLNRSIKTLSDSERFEVLLATALSINPKLIILDDPTCFLDNEHKDKLIKLLKLMKYKYNKTIIIMSSDSEFILKVTDYIYVLDNSKIVLHGDKYKVFTNPQFSNLGLNVPKIIEFQKQFAEKGNIKITYRDNIDDLIKDIYFYIEKKKGDV